MISHPTEQSVSWQHTNISSPKLPHPLQVVVAKHVPTVKNGIRLQNLNIYVRDDIHASRLVDQPVSSLPQSSETFPRSYWHVHIHGGAWRDPNLLSSSIEAAAAHILSDASPNPCIRGVISLNYTLSPFPTHPTQPYISGKTTPSDPGREARHPQHIQDVLSAFSTLRDLGLKDGDFILTGHSAGACLAFQAALFDARHWGIDGRELPRPVAVVGMNGLYDLPGLVDDLGESHAHLADVYEDLISMAFGDRRGWEVASPARVDVPSLEKRVKEGNMARLVVLDQSTQDQLVPMNQMTMLKARLGGAEGLRVVQGKRCTGAHAAPWEQGYMIWETVKDVLELLDGTK